MTAEGQGLDELENRLGYCFADKQLLLRSLSHPSYLTIDPRAAHNQRLEFLGDAVIGLVLAQALFEKMPKEREGALTRFRSMLANGEQLTLLAREIGLGKFIRIGEAEDAQGGRERDSILEDALEAIIGAAYLDGGLEPAKEMVLNLYGSLSERLEKLEADHNPKGRLQELLQPELGNEAISYCLQEATGPDHQKEFTVEVWVEGVCKGTGKGGSKKLAEEEAARAALRVLIDESDS